MSEVRAVAASPGEASGLAPGARKAGPFAGLCGVSYDWASMRWLADLLYLLAGLLFLPFALYQAVFLKKNRSGWRQRFGKVPTFEPGRRRIWVHAVSLGEINATPALVAALKERLPEAEFVFSTTTDTGYARAVQHYGAERVFRFPLDFSLVVSRVLERVQPAMIVLVELEVWYNLVRMASARGIPVVVVNGRLTGRSHRRMKRVGAFVRPMFADLAWVGAQDEIIASRFISLGVPSDRVEVTGSLKWDSAQVTDTVAGAEALAEALGLTGAEPLWVCGSTGPGEEELILTAYRELMERARARKAGAVFPRLAIVPRKPERFDEVARLVEQRGFTCMRRSICPDSHTNKPEPDAVILGDTMGELRKFYSLASVVFVGRTLVPLGGSDPMEVAALGKPILIGPRFENFELPARALLEAGAAKLVRTANDLVSAVGEVLSDSGEAKAMGERGRGAVLANQGATARTADRLGGLLAPFLQTHTARKMQRNPAAAVAD